MYCAKCGKEIKETDAFCGNCGWKNSAYSAPGQTATPVAAPVKPAEVPVKPAETPVKPAEVSEKKPITFTPMGPNGGTVADAPVPPVTPAPEKPKKKKTGLIIAIILLVVFLFFAGIVAFIGVLIYHNTDAYKVKTAVSYIEEGDLYSANDIIYDSYTDEAMAIKNFIPVEEAKEDFINAMSGLNASSYEGEDVSDEYYAFINAVDYFEESYYYYNLPSELTYRRDAYESMSAFISEYLYGESDGYYYYDYEDSLYDYIYGAQFVMLSEVIRNDSSQYGDSFTLSELQSKLDVAKPALESLDGYDFSSISLSGDALTYCPSLWSVSGSTINISTHTLGIINTLISSCENELSSEQSYIDSNSAKFSLYSNLYMENPDSAYAASVGEYLLKIDDTDDIYSNTEEIMMNLKVEILYALLTGNAATVS